MNEKPSFLLDEICQLLTVYFIDRKKTRTNRIGHSSILSKAQKDM